MKIETMRFDVEKLIRDFSNGNERFRKKAEARVPGIFRTRVKGQTPHTVSIECSDSWVAFGLITNTPFGRIFPIAKNAGNIVGSSDKNTIASITYALNHLPSVNLVIVNGHYDCGGIKGLDAISTGKLEREIEEHLKRALPARKIVDLLVKRKRIPEADRHRAIVEANVLLQEENLLDIPAVNHAVNKRIIQIHGTVYDPFTGILHWGYPTLEKHGVASEVREHFKSAARRRRTR